jgi:hypothetical protein
MFKGNSTNSGKESAKDTIDKIEVTVVPVDDEPYSKVISFSSSAIGK